MKTMAATLIHIFDPYKKQDNERRSCNATQAAHAPSDQLVVDHRSSRLDVDCQLLGLENRIVRLGSTRRQNGKVPGGVLSPTTSMALFWLSLSTKRVWSIIGG